MILSTTLPKSSPAFAAHVVHIEGLDLAGKSTATQALLDRHPGSELRRNALTEGNRPFLLADEAPKGAGTSAETLGQLYVAALRRDIATYEPPSTETVQDSTILLRSLAFNTVIGATNIADELWDLLPYHPRFRTSIVLTAPIEVRLDRLKQRYRNAPAEVAPDDLMVRDAPATFLEMESMLVETAAAHFDASIVDTSDLSRDQVVERILRLDSPLS